jgi:hypothetical protein
VLLAGDGSRVAVVDDDPVVYVAWRDREQAGLQLAPVTRLLDFVFGLVPARRV